MNIIELAKEAGFPIPTEYDKHLERVAGLVRAEALEEAAEYVDRNLYTAGEYAEKLRERAAAIRGLK